jgi:hypothetical protein
MGNAHNGESGFAAPPPQELGHFEKHEALGDQTNP